MTRRDVLFLAVAVALAVEVVVYLAGTGWPPARGLWGVALVLAVVRWLWLELKEAARRDA